MVSENLYLWAKPIVKSWVREVLNEFPHPEQKNETVQDQDLISPKGAREILGISAPTLWRLEKAGKVKIYGIGGKRYLKRSELLESLTLKK